MIFLYYVFDDEVLSVGIDEAREHSLAFGYIPFGELETAVDVFGLPKSSLVKISTSLPFRNELICYEDCLFATMNIINAVDDSFDNDYLAIYVTSRLLLVVNIYDKDGSLRDKAMEAISGINPMESTIFSLVHGYMEAIISGDGYYLQRAQENIDALEKQVLTENVEESFNLKLLREKQQLLYLFNYYDHLIDITSRLRENQGDMLGELETGSFDAYLARLERLKDNVRMLRDSVVHLRDAYQSSLDIRLNQTMKIFTLFTVFFSPLSFVCGWYGMNFRYMPELSSPYGYWGVIGFSVLIVVGLVAWFKHKRWI